MPRRNPLLHIVRIGLRTGRATVPPPVDPHYLDRSCGMPQIVASGVDLDPARVTRAPSNGPLQPFLEPTPLTLLASFVHFPVPFISRQQRSCDRVWQVRHEHRRRGRDRCTTDNARPEDPGAASVADLTRYRTRPRPARTPLRRDLHGARGRHRGGHRGRPPPRELRGPPPPGAAGRPGGHDPAPGPLASPRRGDTPELSRSCGSLPASRLRGGRQDDVLGRRGE